MTASIKDGKLVIVTKPSGFISTYPVSLIDSCFVIGTQTFIVLKGESSSRRISWHGGPGISRSDAQRAAVEEVREILDIVDMEILRDVRVRLERMQERLSKRNDGENI